MLYHGFQELMAAYDSLEAGDRFVGRIPSNALKTAILLDLTARGVVCIPGAKAQMLSGSKVAQAMFLRKWMLPHTRAILGRRDLLKAMIAYRQAGIGKVVTKEDCRHCGHGLRIWPTLEDAYNVLGFSRGQEPLVLQPYRDDCIDVRVIWVDPYIEAYRRRNTANFRNNLSLGGTSSPFRLNREQTDFCRQVVSSAGFPWAHIDLMIGKGKGEIYLSEIALNGGIRGALIERRDLEDMKRQKVELLLEN